MAVKLESGNEECPLVVSYVQEPPSPAAPKAKPQPAPIPTPDDAPVHNPERDYESLVLMKLRQAEERKKLAEQLAAEDT